MARLTDINIPKPNPAIREVQKSARMREIVLLLASVGVDLYQAKVAKRTTRLARSARASAEIGGNHNNMWVGVVTVGQGLSYELPHEFGADVPLFGDEHDKFEQHPAHDLNFVLENLGGYA